MRPQGIERPAQIFQRIAQMRHFPVEDGADFAVGIEQEIARAVVAMHDANLLRRWRRIALEPANGRACDRLRLALVLVDHLLPACYLVAPAELTVRWSVEVTKIDGVRLGRR